MGHNQSVCTLGVKKYVRLFNTTVIMNPISTLDNSLLWIDSRHRTSGNPADFTVNIPNSVDVKGVVKVVPQIITFPHLFPNVENVNVTYVTGGSNVNVSIGSNWYTTSTLVTAWNSHASVSNGTVPSLSITDGKFVFTSTTTGNLILGSEFAKILGIVVNEIAFDVSASNTVYAAEHFPNLSGPQHIFVHMSEMCSANLIRSLDGKTSNCVAVVPLGGRSFGQMISHTFDDIQMGSVESKRPVHVDRLSIRLQDDNHNTVSVPFNFDFSMILKIYHVDTTKF